MLYVSSFLKYPNQGNHLFLIMCSDLNVAIWFQVCMKHFFFEMFLFPISNMFHILAQDSQFFFLEMAW